MPKHGAEWGSGFLLGVIREGVGGVVLGARTQVLQHVVEHLRRTQGAGQGTPVSDGVSGPGNETW